MPFFTQLQHIHMPQKIQNCQTILREKNKAGGMTLPNFRQYHQATIIKQHHIGTKPDIKINGTVEIPEVNYTAMVN